MRRNKSMLKSLIEILSQLQCEYEACIVQVHKLYENINYKYVYLIFYLDNDTYRIVSMTLVVM